MLFALVLFQLAVATPTPRPTRPPPMLGKSAPVVAGPRSLADAAKEKPTKEGNVSQVESSVKYTRRNRELESISGTPVPTASEPTGASAGAEQQLRAFCEARWKTDASMVGECKKKQREAAAKLQISGPRDVPYGTFAKIRASCAQRWSDDFTMQVSCEAKQVTDFRESQR